MTAGSGPCIVAEARYAPLLTTSECDCYAPEGSMTSSDTRTFSIIVTGLARGWDRASAIGSFLQLARIFKPFESDRVMEQIERRASGLPGVSPVVVASQCSAERSIYLKDELVRRGVIVVVDETAPTQSTSERRKPIPEHVGHGVWRRDGGACVDCGSRERLEFDHIIPPERGWCGHRAEPRTPL